VWWWSVALFGANVGYPIAFLCAAMNSLVLLITAVYFNDKRMLSRKEREQQYKEYMRTTSAMIPWFKLKDPKRNKKN
jgi:steroid 5-alpha reductase family enzyme